MDTDALRQKMLFLGLSDEQLQAVAGVVRTKNYRAGEVVVRRGDVDDALYIIERGSVEMRAPDPVEERVVAVFEKGSYVDEAYAGDFFGEFSLVDLEPWSGTIVARERTLLLQLKRDDLYELFSRDVDLQIGVVLNIARVLSRRLRIRNRRLVEPAERKK
ncbi:MAG TPA: cyclic nucleotide-binding domain-containing protein [Planctomycetota bacterium]|nr:cyclic nucleotide-binding domain-containing protein [Planctomycetota bacterium]